MRRWVLTVAALLAAAAWGAGTAHAGKVEVKGAHICCPNCQKAIGAALKGVDGVGDPACSVGGSITFTTKDDKTTSAALKALADAGFDGTATDDGKDAKFDLPTATGKADTVTVSDTHVCCGKCQKAIQKLFPDAKSVEFPDKTTVTITGKDIDKATVLDALHKAGFNGTIK